MTLKIKPIWFKQFIFDYLCVRFMFLEVFNQNWLLEHLGQNKKGLFPDMVRIRLLLQMRACVRVCVFNNSQSPECIRFWFGFYGPFKNISLISSW